MSRCPKCQHDLSAEDFQASQCPACGHVLGEGAASHSGQEASGGAAPGDPQSRPQATPGGVDPGTGLSSTPDPETWNADESAKTFVGEDLRPDEYQLTPDDVVSMSMHWQGIEDDVESGQTIKSLEPDELAEVDESSATLSADDLLQEEFGQEGFEADASSKTASFDDPSPADEDESATSATFISDEFMPVKDGDSEDSADGLGSASDSDSDSQSKDWSEASVSDTFVSDEFPATDGSKDDSAQDSEDSSEGGPHHTPSDDAGLSSYDQTMVADDFASAEQDSQDLVDESAKTVPLSDQGDWVEGNAGDTFIPEGESPLGTPTQEGTIPGGKPGDAADSGDQTMISDQFSDPDLTGSGSAEQGGGRTDPISVEESAGFEAAAESGLNINLRTLKDQNDPASEEADYMSTKLLGEGGMGYVHRAKQTAIDREVAVKTLKERASGKRKDQQTKFIAEAVVTGELAHPNIVPIYDMGHDENGALFYSMKIVTGNPWLQTVHHKSTQDNLTILLSVADAVAFAHARGVVHRDLKPENVMLGEFGEILVMDWGLAMPTENFNKLENIVRSTSMGGTPAYMAPEMATGPITKIGPHSDVYLLGAILFEIVTGRPPHRGKNAMKCLMSAARNKIVSTDHTGELIEIAYKAMATDPADRYKSVREFQAAVRTYLAHSESLTLMAAAEKDLERAQSTDSYEDYSKARFGFEESLKLWSENKRARTSLGAARLAYAHCAMDKGDYDLADSLLESGDLAHEKLKVDIAKARDERDARQKRLDAAKRLGMGLALLLFVVISGAAVWINSARADAVEAKDQALIAKQQAEDAEKAEKIQRTEAERLAAQETKLKNDALLANKREREAREEAERQRKLAVSQEQIAELSATYADEQAIVADEQRAEAEKQRIEADSQRARAVGQTLFASLNAVYAAEQAIVADEERKAAELSALAEAEAKQVAIAQSQFAEVIADYAGEQAIVAEEERANALVQQGIAEEQRANAVKQEGIAVQQKREAVAQAMLARLTAIVADEQRTIADEQRLIADNERITADKQRNLAEQRKKEAVAQEMFARVTGIYADEQAEVARVAAISEREARLNEEREAYISKVGLAAAKIEENSFDAAKELLLSTNAQFRNWEWGYLMHLCDGFEEEFKSETPQRLEAVAVIGDGQGQGQGQEFVVGGESGLLEIRDSQNNKLPAKGLSLPKHLTVFDVAASPKGDLIAVATDDHKTGYIKLWSQTEQKWLDRTFGDPDTDSPTSEDYKKKLPSRHMDTVVSVQFSQDGTKLLSGSKDSTARVWNVVTGEQLTTLPTPNSEGHAGTVYGAVFCPTFTKDAQGNLKPVAETRIVTVGEDTKALVWVDPTAGWKDPKRIKTLPPFSAHKEPLYSVSCSPDGQYIATGGFGRRVFVWRLDDIPNIDNKERIKMQIAGDKIPETPYRELVGHDASIRSVEFGTPSDAGPRDLVLLTGSDDNTVKVWTVDRESSLEKFSPVKTFRGHGGYVRDCVFNSKGTWILSVSHDNTSKRWSLEEDAKTEVHLVNGSPLDGHNDNVDAVAFSFSKENGQDVKKAVTAGRDKTAQIYRMDNQNRWKKERSVSEGHENLIPAGVYFDNGKKLVTASFDGTARVWDVLAGTELHTLKGTSPSGAVAVSPLGRWILTGANNPNPDDDNPKWQAKLWNAETGELVDTFGEYADQITAVAFSREVDDEDNILLAIADARGRCSLWKFQSKAKTVGDERAVIRFQNRYAHNERIVALRFLPNDQRLLSASMDKSITQWNTTTGQPVNGWELSHPKGVTSMDVTPDGKWVATTCDDNVVRLWSVDQRQVVKELRPEGRVTTLVANVLNVFISRSAEEKDLKAAWKLINPDANYEEFLALGGWEQGVDELVTQIPQQLGDLKKPPRELAGKLADLITGISREDLLLPSTRSVAVSPDGRYIAVANRDDRITHGWRLSANPNAQTQPVSFVVDDDRDVWSVAFSPAEARTDLAVLGFSDARQWMLVPDAKNDVKSTPSVTLNAQGEVASASFSPDGQYLVTGTSDRAARIWNVKTGQDVLKLPGLHKGQVNAAIWSPKTPKSLSNNPKDQFILTASQDKMAILWKLTPDAASVFKVEKMRVFEGHADEIMDAAFAPDGTWIVTVSKDRTVRVWDTSNGDVLVESKPQDDDLLCVAVAEDGERILTGSANKQAIIWQLTIQGDTAQLKEQLVLKGHSAQVTDVAFSPLEDLNGDGELSAYEKYGLRAVTASEDNTVIVWDTRVPTDATDLKLSQGKQVLALKRHNRPVKSVTFSPDGRYILTGSEDNRAIVWPTKDWMAEKLTELEEADKRSKPVAESVTALDK